MKSFTRTEIWGIPIRVGSSLVIFLPILAWLIGSGQQIALYAGIIEGLTGTGFDVARLRAGTTPWVVGAAAAVGLFVSVTVHELGHSWVALRYDLEIESITLWILGGLAALKTFPRSGTGSSGSPSPDRLRVSSSLLCVSSAPSSCPPPSRYPGSSSGGSP
jgi:Zn-dependent protease